MTVQEQSGAGHEPGMHAPGVPGVELDDHEALPGGTSAKGRGAQAAQESFLELEDFFHVHGGDERLGSGGMSVGDEDVIELVAARRHDGGALVHGGGIEQVEHGEALHGEDLVHAFQAQAALLVEEIRDVGLLESGLAGEAEAGQLAGFDAIPEDVAKIILQDFELHWRSIAPAQSAAVSGRCSGGGLSSFPLGFARGFGKTGQPRAAVPTQ